MLLFNGMGGLIRRGGTLTVFNGMIFPFPFIPGNSHHIDIMPALGNFKPDASGNRLSVGFTSPD
jgi:hypothetical protein